MKKLILIGLIFIAISNCLYAQESTDNPSIFPPPDYFDATYDTMIWYNPYIFENAVYTHDENLSYTFYDTMYRAGDTSFDYYDPSIFLVIPEDVVMEVNILYNAYDSDDGFYDMLIGKYCDSTHKGLYANSITTYAQPWHLDSNVTICGVALWLKGYGECRSGCNCYYRLLDTNFNILAEQKLYWRNQSVVFSNEAGFETIQGNKTFDNYYFTQPVVAKDFLISVDRNSRRTRFDHTFSLTDSCLEQVCRRLGHPYDTLFIGRMVGVDTTGWRHVWAYDPTVNDPDSVEPVINRVGPVRYNLVKPTVFNRALPLRMHYDFPILDTIVLWHSPYSPYFINEQGAWTRFADDPGLSVYQSAFFKLLPIILMPKNPAGTEDVALEKNTWLYPNPAKDRINIVCGFKIKTIDVMDINGKLILQKEINDNETIIEVNNLPKGSYVAKLYTSRGIIAKTFIKQ